jgi:hypothetical protein
MTTATPAAAKALTKVLSPDPFGPIRPTRSLRATEKSTPDERRGRGFVVADRRQASSE